jgi:phage shock protein PspC (stress-responsive transcriptional regulator)
MTRLAFILSIICGGLLVLVAYLSLTVIQQREEISCGNRQAHSGRDCL